MEMGMGGGKRRVLCGQANRCWDEEEDKGNREIVRRKSNKSTRGGKS